MESSGVNNDLKVGITNKQILAIALPITFAILIPQINFITNNIFLGEWSKTSLGDAGITGVYYLVVAVAGNGFNNAMQSLISKTGGEGNTEKIYQLMHQAVRIALQYAVVAILFTWFLAPLILKPFLQTSSYDAQMEFLKIRVWGLPFLYLFQLGNAFLVGTLNSRYLMIGFAFETITNIFFDYTLIMGRLGFPQLGFNGAAVASVLAEIISFAAIWIAIIKLQLHLRFKLFSRYLYNKIISKEILHISAPLVLQYVLSLTTWLIFFILIEENYGVDEKAISNIMRNVFGFAGIFIWAFASTTNAMVSNIIGQGQHHEVIKVIKKIMMLSVGSAVLMCGILNLFPYTFFSIFGQGEAFAEKGIPVLRIASTAMLMMSIAVVWMNGLTGTGQTRKNVAVEIVAISLYLVYTFYIIKILQLPIFYAWSNEWVYWTIIFTMSFIFMNKDRWKSKNSQVK